MWSLKRWLLVAAVVLVSATTASAFWFIRDMYDQISVKPQEGVPRALPENSVPTVGKGLPTDLPRDAVTPLIGENPIPYSNESVARGREHDEAHCLVCHGDSGAGDGPVAAKGAKPWWPLGSPQTQNRSDQHIFAQIWAGNAVMGSYRWSLEPEEIWDLVNYVRSLDQR